MRLKQRIDEGRELTQNDFLEAVSLVIKDCKEGLKQYIKKGGPNLLMHSGRSHREDYFKGFVRKDRKPTDTKIELHNRFDDMLNGKFGWKPRSNSIFVTGDVSDAGMYGTPYIIFPAGKTKYVWSPDTKDLYVVSKRIIRDTSRLKDEGIAQMRKDWRDKYNNPSKGTNGSFKYVSHLGKETDIPDDIQGNFDSMEEYILLMMPEALHKGSIIWVPGMTFDEYYMANTVTFFKNLRIDVDKVRDDEFTKLISKYKNTNLRKAISSNKEIMLNCEIYHAFKSRRYSQTFLEYFHTFGWQGHKTDQEYINWWDKRV